MKPQKVIRIKLVMEMLHTSAYALERECGVSHSLISKWQQGVRNLTKRSKQIVPVAKTLLRLDTSGQLEELLAPYRHQGESDIEALCEYLTGEDLPGLIVRAEPPKIPYSGDYTVQSQAFLGKAGFYRSAAALLEYVLVLPPNREIIVVGQEQCEWIANNTGFAEHIFPLLQKAFARGARLLFITPSGGYLLPEASAHTGPWLAAQMRGSIRSLYGHSFPPEDTYVAASIPGFLCGTAEIDTNAEDNLYTILHTDPRAIRSVEALCKSCLEQSTPSLQFGFFEDPTGETKDGRLWEEGPLPAWANGPAPDGSFFAVCRVPGIALTTKSEFAEIVGKDTPPTLPEYFTPDSVAFSSGPHKIILCREDVREALMQNRRMHETFSKILDRRAFIPRGILTAQISRLLAVMERQDNFEVALVPRVAFAKLQAELVCWNNSVSVGWLQDISESILANEESTSGSYHTWIDHVWDRLLAGWRRKSDVVRQLRKWLSGKELRGKEIDSAIVRGWDSLQKK